MVGNVIGFLKLRPGLVVYSVNFCNLTGSALKRAYQMPNFFWDLASIGKLYLFWMLQRLQCSL
jgi:hypothetical protein